MSRHVNIRCTTTLCGMVRLNHTDVPVVVKLTPRSSVTLRLNQTHRGLCRSRDQCNQPSPLCGFHRQVCLLLGCSLRVLARSSNGVSDGDSM